MTPESELTLAAAADLTAIAWALQRHARYLQGPSADSALAEVFAPVLALAWAYMALMRVLVP